MKQPKYVPVEAYAQRHGMTVDEVFHAALDGRLTLALRVDDQTVYAWKREPDERFSILAVCTITGFLTVPVISTYGFLQGAEPQSIDALKPLSQYPPIITVYNDQAWGEPLFSLEGLMPPFGGKLRYNWASGDPGMPVDNALSEIKQHLTLFLPATPLRVTRNQFVVIEQEHWIERRPEPPGHPLAAVELGRLLDMLNEAEPDRKPLQTVFEMFNAVDTEGQPILRFLPAHPQRGEHVPPVISRNEINAALTRLPKHPADPDVVTVSAGQSLLPVIALWIVRNDWRNCYAARSRESYPWPSSSDAATFCWWPVVESGKTYPSFMVDHVTGNVDDFSIAKAKLWTPFETVSWLLSTRPADAEQIAQRYDLYTSPNRYVAHEDAKHLPDFVARFRRLWRDINDAIALGELVPKDEDKRLIPDDAVRWAIEHEAAVPKTLADLIGSGSGSSDAEHEKPAGRTSGKRPRDDRESLVLLLLIMARELGDKGGLRVDEPRMRKDFNGRSRDDLLALIEAYDERLQLPDEQYRAAQQLLDAAKRKGLKARSREVFANKIQEVRAIRSDDDRT